MKKYYKIPMTERIIKVNDTSLFDILLDHYPDLYNREKGRVELQYGIPEPGIMTPQLEEAVNEYNQETKRLYMEQGVPTHIIAIGNNEGVTEYFTHTPIQTSGYDSFLQGREVSRQEAYEYLDQTQNYIEQVSKMFAKKESKSLRKVLVQKVTSILKSKTDN